MGERKTPQNEQRDTKQLSKKQKGCVRAFVRWATGKRLANCLPKLGLITLSPPSEQRDSWSSYGAVRAYSEVLYNIWGPRESDSSDSWREENHFSLKSIVFMVDVIFDSRRSTHGLSTTLFVKALLIVRWATGKRLTNRLPKLSLIKDVGWRQSDKAVKRQGCLSRHLVLSWRNVPYPRVESRL